MIPVELKIVFIGDYLDLYRVKLKKFTVYDPSVPYFFHPVDSNFGQADNHLQVLFPLKSEISFD
jgi:hypothetical protein